MGGIAWVFIYPHLSGEKAAEKRRAIVTRAEPAVRTNSARVGQRNRREQVEETLKELETREKKSKSATLATRIAQAGLEWSKQQFMMIAAGLGLAAFLIVFILDLGLLPALGIGFAAAFGLPFWLLAFLKKRRETK